MESATKPRVLFAAAMVADHGPVATAYLHRSARQLAEIAHTLVRDAGTHLTTGFLATPFLFPSSPTPATSTSPTTSCSRTPSHRGS